MYEKADSGLVKSSEYMSTKILYKIPVKGVSFQQNARLWI